MKKISERALWVAREYSIGELEDSPNSEASDVLMELNELGYINDNFEPTQKYNKEIAGRSND